MSDEKKEIPVYIDLIPNWLSHPLIGESQKKELADSIKDNLASKIGDVVNRYASIPALMVHHGEYSYILMEARELFIYGYFYSCVAMCGFTAERILKDILIRSLRINSHGKIELLNEGSIKRIELLNFRIICDFLKDAGIIDENLESTFKKLAKLRNKYAHARGKEPEADARKAVDYLHEIIEGTVSILKDYKIKEGLLVPKER